MILYGQDDEYVHNVYGGGSTSLDLYREQLFDGLDSYLGQLLEGYDSFIDYLFGGDSGARDDPYEEASEPYGGRSTSYGDGPTVIQVFYQGMYEPTYW